MEPNRDTFNETVSSLLERKVRGWLGGVIEDMRKSSPVQQWLDSLPATPGDDVLDPTTPEDNYLQHSLKDNTQHMPHKEEKPLHNTVLETEDKTSSEDSANINLDISVSTELWKRKSLESGVLTSTPHKQTSKKLQRDLSIQSEGYAPKTKKNPLLRDASLQSDASGSSGSSVLNVLGARKVDAESVLLALGFGPSEKQQKLQRIPDRFLVPSKLNGISTDKFIKDEQHSMRMHDCGVFGYRGLTGNPHVPPSTIVAKIMECIVNDDASREQALLRPRYSIGDARVPAAPPAIPPRIANRLHYE